MANCAYVKLPWKVDLPMIELFAREAMNAMFGGFYQQSSKENPLYFEKKSLAAENGSHTCIHRASGWHMDMRHACYGLDMVAQQMEFNSLATCFGACLADDDGIGLYRLSRPGVFALTPMRSICGALTKEEQESSGNHAEQQLAQLLMQFMGAKQGKPMGMTTNMWMLETESLKVAKSLLDPIFFNPPASMLTAKSSPEEKRAEHARMCRGDVVDWGSKIEWSKAVDIAYPGGAGLGVTSAASALLPSAALGIKCSSAALSKASVTGLERALSVALLWMRAGASKEIHSRLIEVAPHPEVSESKAKALCDIAIAKRAKLSEGDAIALHSEMSGALYEALVLERESRHVVKVKVKKASL